jgi:hypothetical protein
MEDALGIVNSEWQGSNDLAARSEVLSVSKTPR